MQAFRLGPLLSQATLPRVHRQLPGWIPRENRRRGAKRSHYASALKFVEWAAAQVVGPGSPLSSREDVPPRRSSPPGSGCWKTHNIRFGAADFIFAQTEYQLSLKSTSHLLHIISSLNFVNTVMLEPVY